MDQSTTAIVSDQPVSVSDVHTSEKNETIIDTEPPRYQPMNPSGLNQTNNIASTFVPSMSPGQWNPMARMPMMYGDPSMNSEALNQLESYQAWSIVNILCCCLCLGIVACFFSSEVEAAKKRGDIQAALTASKNAKTMNIVTTLVGVIIIIGYVLYYTRVFA